MSPHPLADLIHPLAPLVRILLAAGLLTLGASQPLPAWAGPDCRQGAEVRIWTAPLRPQPGDPLEVLAVATDGELDQIQVTDPGGRLSPVRPARYGGPPWSLHGGVFRPARGIYRIEALRGGRVAACTEVAVGGGTGERGSGEWDLATEALYSAWIERLFDAPPEQSLSFKSLAPVLADPSRNFLHGFLGAEEDRRLPAEPDCADLPYYLRTYFAWKLGLPVAYRACTRGSRTSPPRCQAPTIESGLAGANVSVKEFQGLTRRLMDTVHSGSARTALGDEATDYYPVPLTRSALWPGTVYADPYGHVLVLVKWVPQGAGRGGLLLAVDAQPDNSVTRKRFWEGTFLFADTPSAGAGFKAHRPLVATRSGVRPVSNDALNGRSGLPPFSAEQSWLSPEDFYARMERLINPRGLDPETAYGATLEALMEQLETRVTSVDNGEAHVQANPRAVIPMPQGPAIFETTGPWEDYATPSRDMRLLIALHVLEQLPQRIRRYPELYQLGGEGPASAAGRIERLHERQLQTQTLTYTRSDGSPWRLSLAEIYDRRPGLEVGYNPNDCVERRWGATPETPDHATCRRRAPADQRARMEEYRPWFHERRRPPR
ncbi:MAG: hypothetical protein ACM3ST_15400 [Bdellovibrio bacteriovorus]